MYVCFSRSLGISVWRGMLTLKERGASKGREVSLLHSGGSLATPAAEF